MKRLFSTIVICFISKVILSQTTYTFTGNGNWTAQTNWAGALLPPSVLPVGSTINIYPQPGDSCILDTVQVIPNGATLNIGEGAIFIIKQGWKLLTLTPILTTGPVLVVEMTGTVVGGNIISTGGSALFESGIVWDTLPNPTVELSNKSFGWSSTVNYLAYAGDLRPGTTYYIRAYATNNAGTGYGNEIKITTPLPLSNVMIGTQIWSSKNLDVVTYRNGDPIPQVTDSAEWASLTTGAWCYPDNDPALGAVYGKLYNWYAVNDPRGLAPVSWHVPSNAEWNVLVKHLDAAADTANILGVISNVTGAALKDTGTLYWFGPNAEATNASGFTGLPAGGRHPAGSFYQSVGQVAYWWSATTYLADDAWFWFVSAGGSAVSKIYANKHYGYSVRCVKD